MSPEERFRALSLSEQTTFDAVTHALMRSSLTDEDRTAARAGARPRDGRSSASPASRPGGAAISSSGCT